LRRDSAQELAARLVRRERADQILDRQRDGRGERGESEQQGRRPAQREGFGARGQHGRRDDDEGEREEEQEGGRDGARLAAPRRVE
jgi:hypothetical protein